MSSNNPPPSPPGHQQQVRPRAKSSFSFRSNHSQKSSGSGPKVSLHETHEEKQSHRLNSKADPSMALNEAEPSAVANSVATSLAPLRAIQHLDAQGNPIVDPDRNNPTRSRWERPLDTIRSFEAAIDGNYSRKTYMRPESAVGDAQSTYTRRNSYFGGTQVTQDERPRYPQNGYYGGGRAQSYRPDNYGDGRGNGMTRPDSYYNNGDYGGPSNGYTPNRARYPRTASEPHFNSGHGVYPVPGQQQSYETVATASGSGSSPDTIGYSTDPSSENSSLDRIAVLPKDPNDNYGFNGFGSIPQYAPPGSGINEQYSPNGAQRQGIGYLNQAPPPPPPQKEVPRVPIKLGTTSGNVGAGSAPARPSPGEKRKSWFGKKFSKNS